MAHGTQSFFVERGRNARRLSLISAGLGLALLSSLELGRVPRIHRTLNDPARWGFEGPEQYVRRITLEQPPGKAQTLRDLGVVREHSALRGGARTPAVSKAPGAEPETRPRILGPGDSPEDLLARAYSRRADVPVVQSEELVIEKLVRPAYPQHAYEHDIEGRVSVLALVDTSGRVVEVQILTSESVARREFGEAASEAVWRCQFRPYRLGGLVHEVYALFRYNFTIY